MAATAKSDSPGSTPPDNVVDEEKLIVQRARRGDSVAFEQLYRTHVNRVYALCMRMTADPAEAEELTQVAFIRAWEKLWTFRGGSAFGTWLHRLTVNVVLTERRSRSRRLNRVTTTDDLSRYDKPVQREDSGAKMDLDAALKELPEGARTVFVLHDVEGYKHKEIAELMGVTDGASKAQLHRARNLLRKALAR